MSRPIEDSWLFQHMVQALEQEPSWTIHMYLILNDLDGTDTGKQLKEAYDRRLEEINDG